MLQPPGASSAGQARRQAASASRRNVQENPDEVVRQLQRLPPNKKCCDCSSKLPACVNVTVGCFVCMVCAGIHRELNQRVKGVGHSSFTTEEVEMLKSTDNEKINAVYMARYNPRFDRMRMPQDNVDQQHLRAWIRRKYQEKAWFEAPQGGGGGGGGPANQQQQATQQQQRNQYGQPTVVQVPPKQQQQPQVDLFGGFGGGPPAPAPAPNNQGWDAFGNQSHAPPQQQQQQPPQQQAPFQANFANFQQPPAAPAPPQQQPQVQQSSSHDFPADFGSSHAKQLFQQHQQQQQQMQPPPQQQQFQTNFANFPNQQQPPPQQQQHPGAGNFANFPPNQQQQQPGAGNFGSFPATQPPQQQPGGFANFDQQNQQGHPQQQHQQPGGFANFSQPGPQPQGPPPGQQPMAPPPQQQQGFPQQGGFANFSQQQPPPPHMQGPPQPSSQLGPGPQNQQQGGFANFSQQPPQMQMQGTTPLPSPSKGPGMQQQQGGFGNFSQQPPQQLQVPPPPSPAQQGLGAQQPQGGFASFSQQQPQMMQGAPQPAPSQQGPGAPQQPQGMSFHQGFTPQQQQGGGFGNFQQQPAGQPPQQQNHGQFGGPQATQMKLQQQQPLAAQPQSDLSVSTGQSSPQPMQRQQPAASPSIASATDSMEKVKVSSSDEKSKAVGQSKFKSGQRVYYKSASVVGPAEIVKVHFDDQLEPFYTVKIDGKEKQTDDAHLSNKHPKQEEIEKMLSGLTEAQLQQVHDFVSQLARSSGASTPPRSTVGGRASPGSLSTQSAPAGSVSLAPASNHAPAPASQVASGFQGAPNQNSVGGERRTPVPPNQASPQAHMNGPPQPSRSNEGMQQMSQMQQPRTITPTKQQQGMSFNVNNNDKGGGGFSGGIPSPTAQGPAPSIGQLSSENNKSGLAPLNSQGFQGPSSSQQMQLAPPGQPQPQVGQQSNHQPPLSPKGNPFDFY